MGAWLAPELSWPASWFCAERVLKELFFFQLRHIGVAIHLRNTAFRLTIGHMGFLNCKGDPQTRQQEKYDGEPEGGDDVPARLGRNTQN